MRYFAWVLVAERGLRDDGLAVLETRHQIQRALSRFVVREGSGMSSGSANAHQHDGDVGAPAGMVDL
jgi:hypothetical protein